MTEEEWITYSNRLVMVAAEQGRCRGLNEAAKMIIDITAPMIL